MRRRIGDYLVKIKVLTPLQVATVLERQDDGDGRDFMEIAAALGYLSRDAFQRHFSDSALCRYAPYCHFHAIRKMTPNQQNLKDVFCLQWPQRCTLHQRRQAGKPVFRTLWPEADRRDS